MDTAAAIGSSLTTTGGTLSTTTLPIPLQVEPEVPLTIPECSERLLWRLARLYRDIVFLATLPENTRQAAFAGNAWFCRKYKCDQSTVRRWFGWLERHGWIRREISGPNRLAFPASLPSDIIKLCPRFKRLLTGILRVFGGPSTISTGKVDNSNSLGHTNPKPKLPTPADLPAADAVVAVQAQSAGVSGDKVATLLLEVGRRHVLDALALLAWRKNRGKAPENPGGWLWDMAHKLKTGEWLLPERVAEARDREERAEERKKAAPPPPAVPTPAVPTPTPAVPTPTPAVPAPTPAVPAPTPAVPALSPLSPAVPIPPALVEPWQRVREALRPLATKPVWGMHLQKLAPAAYDENEVPPLVVFCVSPANRDQVEKHGEDIRTLLSDALGIPIAVSFRITAPATRETRVPADFAERKTR